MARSALGALECALALPQRITALTFSKGKGLDVEEMVDATDRVEVTKRCLNEAMEELLKSVRFSRGDPEDFEHSAKLSGDVGYVDDALRILNGEFGSLCMDRKELHQKRSRVHSIVRTAMPYDDEKYGSKAEYERAIVKEMVRRMKVSDRHSSSLLIGIVKKLKDSDANEPGRVPKAYSEVFDSDESRTVDSFL